MALNKKRPEYPYLKQSILDAFNRGIFYPETSPLVCSSNSYLRQYFFSVASVLSMGGSPGLVVMGGRIVGLNPGTIYWMDMTFFTLICCKNCNNVCLKIPKINQKETRNGPLKSVLSKNAPTLVAFIGIMYLHLIQHNSGFQHTCTPTGVSTDHTGNSCRSMLYGCKR